MEAYVAPGDRRARERVSGDRGKPYYHLVLLAQNAVDHKNLVKLSSLAYTQRFYSNPLLARDPPATSTDGTHASSARPAGQLRCILQNVCLKDLVVQRSISNARI